MNQETLDKFDLFTQNPDLSPADFKQLSGGLIEIARNDMGIENFSCSEEYLLAIDPLLETIREALLADSELFLINTMRFASFLGETLIELFNGAWVYNPEFSRWGIEVETKNNDKIFFNVFHKIKNRIINGEEDSISYYYQLNKKIIKAENNAS